MKRPCLDCGTPSDATRCQRHQNIHEKNRQRKQTQERAGKGGRPQYSAEWKKLSRHIRSTATICWLCGQGPKPGDPFQADHLIPAQHGSRQAAAAAHRSCNIARGNRTRHQTPEQTGTVTGTHPHRRRQHDSST